MAGLAGLGCPGGLTFQVEPGATLQECDGYWANSQRQRPALPTTRVSLQSKTAARCHCHRLLSCIASRYHLLCDSILRISHDTHLPYSLACEYFDHISTCLFLAQPSQHLDRIHTRFLQRRQANPTTLQDPKDKIVPVATTNSRAIIYREQPTSRSNSSPSGS